MKLTNVIELDVSIINTYLRDKYSSLAMLCEEEDLNYDDLINYFNNHMYYYDENINQIKNKA